MWLKCQKVFFPQLKLLDDTQLISCDSSCDSSIDQLIDQLVSETLHRTVLTLTWKHIFCWSVWTNQTVCCVCCRLSVLWSWTCGSDVKKQASVLFFSLTFVCVTNSIMSPNSSGSEEVVRLSHLVSTRHRGLCFLCALFIISSSSSPSLYFPVISVYVFMLQTLYSYLFLADVTTTKLFWLFLNQKSYVSAFLQMAGDQTLAVLNSEDGLKTCSHLLTQ